MNVCLYMCVCIYVWMCVCVCVHVYMYVCVLCMYIYICNQALGGAKNHLVALPDCDVEMAANDIVASFAGCCGQRCLVRLPLLLLLLLLSLLLLLFDELLLVLYV